MKILNIKKSELEIFYLDKENNDFKEESKKEQMSWMDNKNINSGMY